MESSARKHIVYLDILRVAACFFVIVVHVSSNQLYEYPQDSFDYQVSTFFNTLAITAPAIFFMLSGAVFLDPSTPPKPIKTIWGKYILRMAAAYVFWSFLYIFITCYGYYSFSLETVKTYILEFFMGVPMYHMWFIPAIISIYMILPLLKPAFADKQRCRYYLLLFLIVQMIFPTILKFEFPYKYILKNIYEKIPYVLCIGYAGYFVLGYYLSVEELKKKTRTILYVVGVVGFIAAVMTDNWLSVRQGGVVLLLDDIFSLNCFLFAAAVFVAFRYIPWKTGILTKNILKLSRLTFGIYLIHPLIMRTLFEYWPGVLALPAIVWIPMVSAMTFLCSAIVIWIVSRIPVVNKYLI